MIFLVGCGQQKKSNVNSQNKDIENNAIITDDKDSEYDENYYMSELDGKYGFRKIKLGMPLKEFSNAFFVGQNADGTEKAYQKNDEDLSLGSVEFTTIQYKFYKNILWCINVRLKPGSLNCDNFFNMMLAKYGTCIPSSGFVRWEIGDMVIFGQSDRIEGDSYMFTSSPIHQKLSRHNDSQNEKAINEL